MADKTINQLPEDTAPTTDDYVPIWDVGTATSKKVSLQNINAADYVSKAGFLKNFVESGCIWSGDSYASSLNASMTSGFVWIGGKRLTVAAVTSRAFTASKDTYVDLSDNGDGTAAFTYSTSNNNAASQSLATNSIRIATIVAGATNIAASTSIGQGGFANTAPVISSQTLRGFDSLGNIVYPKGSATPNLTTNPYKFSVCLSATQTGIADATFTKVSFNTKNFDTGNNFDAVTNYRFTAPVAGYYQINVFINTLTSASNGVAFEMQALLYKNGSAFRKTDLYPTSTGTSILLTGNLNPLLQLVAGDYLEVFVWQDVSANTTNVLGTTTNSYFDGYLVSAS